MLGNLIFKPLDASALATKAQTYHSTSPQNRFSESFNERKMLGEAANSGKATKLVVMKNEEMQATNTANLDAADGLGYTTRSPKNQMDSLDIEAGV